MNYKNQKEQDKSIEEVISDYTQRYFWNDRNATRITDKQMQYQGIDYQITGKSGRIINIDEKAKYKGALNQIFKFPSVEMSFTNRLGLVQDGWFASDKTKTDYYAFLAIYTSASEPKDITFDNINKVNMLLVSKKDILDMVVNDIRHDAKALRDYCDLQIEANEKDINNRKRYSHGRYWLTYSYFLNEKPVNLVIPRHELEELPRSIQFDITKDSVQRYKKGHQSLEPNQKE